MSHRSLSRVEMEKAGMKPNRGNMHIVKKLTILKVLANEVRDAYDENKTRKESISVRQVVARKIMTKYTLKKIVPAITNQVQMLANCTTGQNHPQSVQEQDDLLANTMM